MGKLSYEEKVSGVNEFRLKYNLKILPQKSELAKSRITLELRNQGYEISHKKVYRLIVILGLKSLKRNKTKYSSHKEKVGKIADNYINSEFYADKTNKNLM